MRATGPGALVAALLLIVLIALGGACGRSPSGPDSLNPPAGGVPTPPPGPVTPPPNNVPVIETISVEGKRPHQPAGFANLGDTVDVAATVRDDETAVDHLQYVWTASTGAFSGTGPRVTWQAPAEAPATPAEVTLQLEIVERYGQNDAFEHRVSAGASLVLHDSVKEVGDMARQFLLDFSDSNILDVGYIMRNFDPDCYGTATETEDVARNRREFVVTASSVGPATVTVDFGGVCPFRARPGDACVHVPVFWASKRLSDGASGAVRGTDQVAAIYRPSRREWRLCDSQFDGEVAPVLRAFIH